MFLQLLLNFIQRSVPVFESREHLLCPIEPLDVCGKELVEHLHRLHVAFHFPLHKKFKISQLIWVHRSEDEIEKADKRRIEISVVVLHPSKHELTYYRRVSWEPMVDPEGRSQHAFSSRI